MKKINHGLSENQLKIICRTLIPFIDNIESISLFGSRATGLYKPNSDIDMVIYGSVDEKTINRLIIRLRETKKIIQKPYSQLRDYASLYSFGFGKPGSGTI